MEGGAKGFRHLKHRAVQIAWRASQRSPRHRSDPTISRAGRPATGETVKLSLDRSHAVSSVRLHEVVRTLLCFRGRPLLATTGETIVPRPSRLLPDLHR